MKLSQIFDNIAHYYDRNLMAGTLGRSKCSIVSKMEMDVLDSLLRRLGQIDNELALDIGCGTGRASEALVRRNSNVVGIDISREMLRNIKRKMTSFFPTYMLAQADLFELPFIDGCFSIVTCIGVMDYYKPIQAPRVMAEIDRMLSDDGAAIVSFQDSDSPLIDDYMSATEPELKPYIHLYSASHVEVIVREAKMKLVVLERGGTHIQAMIVKDRH